MTLRLKAVPVITGYTPEQNERCAGYSPNIVVYPSVTLSGKLADSTKPAKADWNTAEKAKVKLLYVQGGLTKDVNNDGTFSFTMPKTTITGITITYAINVTAENYVAKNVSGLATGSLQEIVLTPKTYAISGTVMSYTTASVLPDADVVAVRVVNGANVFSDVVKSDQNGVFTVMLKEKGTYWLWASKEGYLKAEAGGTAGTGIPVDDTTPNFNYDTVDYVMLRQKTVVAVTYDPAVSNLYLTAQPTAFSAAGFANEVLPGAGQ